MWPNLQETVDSVTFTEEILNGKLHSLCNVLRILSYLALVQYYHKELRLITMQKPPFRKVWVFSIKDTWKVIRTISYGNFQVIFTILIHFKYKNIWRVPFRLYVEWSSSIEIKQQKKSYMKTKTHEKY